MAKRILFFEHDEDFAQEIKAGFDELGAKVDIVDDGPSGLEHAAANMPDLILLTIELPGMNGFLVCKKIKKSTGLKDIPLVILSSEASAETFEQHSRLRTHAQKYLHKPISFSDVLKTVQDLISFDEVEQTPDEEELEEVLEVEDEIVMLPEDELSVSEIPQEEATYLVDDADQFANDAFESLMTEADQTTKQEEPVPELEPEPEFEAVPEPAPEPEPLPEPELEPTHQFEAERVAASGDEFDGLKQELDNARQTISQLQQQLQNERSAASGRKGAGLNRDRELLDLKEQLNRKDRELLGLKDQVSNRDKQLLEARDENLRMAREIADLRDNVTTMEGELVKERDAAQTLSADNELAKKRFDELKIRMERIELKSRELEEELDRADESTRLKLQEVEAEHQRALETARQAHESDLLSLREELEAKTLREINEYKEKAAQDMEQITRAASESEKALEEARATLQRIEEEKRNLEESLAEVADDRDSKADELANARSNVDVLESNNRGLQARINEVTNKLDQAMKKIEGDEELLKRVRKAMAIGIGLLEEQKQNQVGN